MTLLDHKTLLRGSAVTLSLAMASTAFAQDSSNGDADYRAPSEREGQYLEREDGARIFYEVSGEGDPIVLLHGYPLSGALFAGVRDELDDDYQVITVDHRGYGNSKTPSPVEDVTTYAEDAIAVLNEIGVDNAVIGGMSMGGPIAFSMYRQAPDLFRGLILIDTTAGPADPIETGIWEGTQTVLNEGEVSDIIPFLMNKMLTGETRMNRPELVAYMEDMINQASLDGALGGARVLAGRPDSSDLLGEIDLPTLVLVGTGDPVYPYEVSQDMADTLSNGNIAMIDDANHAAIIERPEESALAIKEWMSDIDDD